MIRLLAFLTAAIFCMAAGSASAAKRVALVIGNADYQHATPLANPSNDAEDMAGKLRSMGFEVVSGTNLDLEQTRDTVRDFVRKLDGAELALFFYAGHGLQVNGNNYIAPVDAELSSHSDLDFETMPIDLIVSSMERSSPVNLVFLDACRNNPLARNLARSMGTRSGSVGRGLAKLSSGIGSLIAFATQPGNVALDGEGRNSPFTSALLEHLGTPGQDITRDLIRVRRAVLEETNGKQVPWDNSSLTGEVVLVPKPQEVAVKEEPAPQVRQETEIVLPRVKDNTVEITFWESIKDTQDKIFFQAYLQQFPQGIFANLAKLKILMIEKKDAEQTKVASRSSQNQDENSEVAELLAKQKEREAELLARQERMEAELKAAREAQKRSAEEARLALERQGDSEDKVEPEPQLQASLDTSVAPETEAPKVDPKKDRELVERIQRELNRIGCSAGGADGIWGRNTENGLRSYDKHGDSELASLDPSYDLLNALENESGRVCPLICGRNQVESNGQCVAKARPKSEKKRVVRKSEPKVVVQQAPPQPRIVKPKRRTGFAHDNFSNH